MQMLCKECGKDARDLPNGAYLKRVNEFGVDGVFQCAPACGAGRGGSAITNALEDNEHTLLSECNDVKILRSLVDGLWSIIDDIDTADDMVKGNDQAYRKLVSERQKHRWDLPVTSDGYSIFIKE